MGRTTTPAYRVEYDTKPGTILTSAAWRVRASGVIPGDGKPNDANLKRHLDALIASFAPGGVNHHADLRPLVITGARIVRQRDGEILAELSLTESEEG